MQLEIFDVAQIVDARHDHFPCFMIITEIQAHDVKGWVQGRFDDLNAYDLEVSATKGQIHRIGRAKALSYIHKKAAANDPRQGHQSDRSAAGARGEGHVEGHGADR